MWSICLVGDSGVADDYWIQYIDEYKYVYVIGNSVRLLVNTLLVVTNGHGSLLLEVHTTYWLTGSVVKSTKICQKIFSVESHLDSIITLRSIWWVSRNYSSPKVNTQITTVITYHFHIWRLKVSQNACHSLIQQNNNYVTINMIDNIRMPQSLST